MKRAKRTRILVIAAVVCAVLNMGGKCGSGPGKRILLVAPAENPVVGESFWMTVETKNFSGQDGFSFVVTYDPAMLAVDGPIDLMHDAGEFSIVPSQVSGTVEVQAAEVTGLPATSGSGEFLANIPFRALAPGATTLSFASGRTARAIVPSDGPVVDVAWTNPPKRGVTITIE